MNTAFIILIAVVIAIITVERGWFYDPTDPEEGRLRLKEKEKNKNKNE